MRFATFAAHTPPPMVRQVKPLSELFSFPSPVSNRTLTGYVGRVAPTLPSCCTLVCWDGDEMHCFRYTTSNALRRCLWSAPSPPPSRRAVVFAHMRSWYAERANANLTLALEDEADVLSWALSTLLLATRE